MAAVASILEQALELTPEERGRLIAQLLDSLDPDDGDTLDDAGWRAAWSPEIERRLREVRDGTAQLVDGDAALTRVRAAAASRKP
jgi:putative addiction module component (TIGR02574 family)